VLIQIVLFVLSGLALVAAALLVWWLLGHDLRRGLALQRRLARDVRSLRLGRMLERRGIDADSYLVEERAERISEQVHNCRNCTQIDRCDQALARTPEPGERYDYCPNASALSRPGGEASRKRR